MPHPLTSNEGWPGEIYYWHEIIVGPRLALSSGTILFTIGEAALAPTPGAPDKTAQAARAYLDVIDPPRGYQGEY